MELHHSKHHNTYVNSFNAAAEKLATAQQLNTPEAIADQIALQPILNFHGGGHINHSLFWENLAPKGKGGGEPPSGELGKAIDSTFGGLENLKKAMNAKLAGIQGSGWAWLVKDNETGGIGIKTYAVSENEPLLSYNIHPTDLNRPTIEPGSRCQPIQTVAGHRCVGTCVLPPISEPESRVLQRRLGCRQLESS